MHAIGYAFIYCYHIIGEIFYRPRLLLMLFLFLLESLLAAGLVLALATIILYYFGMGYWSLFAIGVVMALFLIVMYFLYQLLKARTISTHSAAFAQKGQWARIQTMAWPVLGYTFQHLAPWRKVGSARWHSGKHLILPLMVKYNHSFNLAYEKLRDLRSTKALRFDPNQVAVKPLTTIFCLTGILLGIGLGAWVGFTNAAGIVIPFLRRVQATGLALLVFLAVSWLPLALSAVKLGLYQADILALELAGQSDNLPDLLSKALGRTS